MRWAHDYPAKANAAKAFVNLMKTVPDPVLSVSLKRLDLNERIALVLLGSDLFQDLSYSAFYDLFLHVEQKYPGHSLWEHPIPLEADLKNILNTVQELSSWSLAKNFPGMFWSVGNFVRRHSPLTNWIAVSDITELWRDLGEIYFFGKGAHRPKVCQALYRIVSPKPYGLGITPKSCSKQLHLPLSMGLRRFLSFIGPFAGKNFADMTPVQKINSGEAFCKFITPKLPIEAAHAFQFFLENGKNAFICKTVTNKCKKCPLAEFCPESM